MSTYFLTLLFSLVIVLVPGAYTYLNRKKLDEMTCMMGGMTFGAMAALVVGTYVALPGGDFVGGIVYGTLAGLIVGIPFGRFGGPLGRMEAVMASPMGALMGAMLGVMIRIYDIRTFVIFFYALTIFVMGEFTYVVYKAVNQKRPKLNEFAVAGVMALTLMFPILIFDYPLGTNTQTQTQPFLTGTQTNPTVSVAASNTNNGSQVAVQEVSIKLAAIGYEPSTITLKKDVKARINLQADNNAGCTRAIVFPDFGISKVVPRGGTDVVEFTPTKEGTYKFRCSMGMAWGTLIVK